MSKTERCSFRFRKDTGLSQARPAPAALPSLLLVILTLLASPPAPLRAADKPAEIVEAQKRYEAALAAADKPVRERYIMELQQIKNRAMALKNLDLAIAADSEIKTMSPAATNSVPSIPGIPAMETVTDWENRLIGTSWIWNNGGKFTFQENGRVTPTFSYMKWNVTEPGTVEYNFDNGNHGTILFERSLNRATIHEIHNDKQKVTMPMTRAKD